MRQAAMSYAPGAIEVLARLAGLARDKDGRPLPAARNENSRIAACTALLDRAVGRPRQELGVEGDGASLVLLHLRAAETVSDELEAALARRTITGRAEPAAEPSIIDLNAPPPTE